ncbi:MAG TPA: ATP-dependent DNA helicase RecG [Candidatus Dormibacteraeota bacterium]|nr:ATP-dependent DNA helicase RecG [Candidatus Dormibacteraeota bacterium]
MDLNTPLINIHGVGSALYLKFQTLGINTVQDLLTNYPRKYQDYSNVDKIVDLLPGLVTIKGRIESVVSRYSRNRLHITEAVVVDDTSKLSLVWFNQPYRASSITKGSKYYISGEFGLHHQRMSIINPSIELVSDFPVNTARILPIYRETKGLTSAQIRKVIKNLLIYLQNVVESLPNWMIKDFDLYPLAKAIEIIHFPIDSLELKKARDRIGFEELFDLSLASALNREQLGHYQAVSIKFDEQLIQQLVTKLPFKLTDEQRIAIWQIILDISSDKPMNRLLEGDVGTGKTVAAAVVAAIAVNAGFQVALLAPTEILARQHYQTIYEIFKSINLGAKVGLLTGSMSSSQQKEIKNQIKASKIDFIIGTHSILGEDINLDRLGLIIIDEQHRFGVKQRQLLLNKTAHMPHLLSMTATPIPRSLQLTLFGDLDVSIIKSKPYTKLPIETKIVSLNQRAEVYKSFVPRLENGEQLFVVCPTITDSKITNIRSVEKVYKELSDGVYKDFKVGVLHGKLASDESEKTMQAFIDNKINVLVATTIIEVGINVVNATVIAIENPDRFGLAQIHQLRGRVGRDDKQGYCYLLLNENKPPGKRLLALENIYDGFVLADLDLELRGPGVIYGTMQHGKIGFDLQIATLTDVPLMLKAKKAADQFILKKEKLLQYVQLNERVKRLRSITTLN